MAVSRQAIAERDHVLREREDLIAQKAQLDAANKEIVLQNQELQAPTLPHSRLAPCLLPSTPLPAAALAAAVLIT